jgi:hypothetical protein
MSGLGKANAGRNLRGVSDILEFERVAGMDEIRFQIVPAFDPIR